MKREKGERSRELKEKKKQNRKQQSINVCGRLGGRKEDERMAEIRNWGDWKERPAAEHDLSNLWPCRQWKLKKLTSLSEVSVQVPGSYCSVDCAPVSQQCPTLLLWAVFPVEYDPPSLSSSFPTLVE